MSVALVAYCLPVGNIFAQQSTILPSTHSFAANQCSVQTQTSAWSNNDVRSNGIHSSTVHKTTTLFILRDVPQAEISALPVNTQHSLGQGFGPG